MLKPSFYSLYRQGRFRRPESGNGNGGDEQVERFAVAMLALALKHEPGFRKEFLQHVCGCTETESGEKFLIELEVGGCGDLVLKKEDGPEAFVLEIKIKVPLQWHNQDPRNPAFFTTGYGKRIKEIYGDKGVYILIENQPTDLSKVAGGPPKCLGKSWRDVSFCRDYHPLIDDLSLIHDLFESFGLLGIPEFIYMNTKNMSLGRDSTKLEEAANIHALLTAVADGIESRSRTLDVKWGAEGEYFGMTFLLKDNLNGWFGYTHDKKSKLEVWFYCGNKEAATSIQTRLTQRVSEKHFLEKVGEPDTKNFVSIGIPADQCPDNQEWFISVFHSLGLGK